MPLDQRTDKLHPGCPDNRIVQVVPSVVGIKIVALRPGAQVHGAQQLVNAAERFAPRPFIVTGGCIKKSIPVSQIAVGDPCFGRKTVKLRTVDKQGKRRFGYRENCQVTVHHTVLYKFPYKIGKLLLAEIVLPVQNMLHSHFLHNAGNAGEKIRHGGRAGRVGVGVQKLFAQYRAVGHHRNINDDPLLFANGLVKLVDQAVHGGICLFAVHMPHGQGNRSVRGKGGFLLATAQTGCQKQDKGACKQFLHGTFLFLMD